MKNVFKTALVVAFAVPAIALACEGHNKAESASAPTITNAPVAKKAAAKKAAPEKAAPTQTATAEAGK